MKIRWSASLVSIGLLCSQAAFAGPALTVLHAFGRGDVSAANPYAEVILGSDGALYGTTSAGGPAQAGTVFRMNPDGSGFAVLKSFAGNDGARPLASLLEGPDGALYGTTEEGGQSGLGTVFRIQKNGNNFSVLKSFAGGSDGANPEAPLLLGSDGQLYGTASGGGTNDYGTVFRLSTNGDAFTTLVQFSGTNGANPECGLIEASDGMLYGAAYSASGTNVGAIFRLQKDGTAFSAVKLFQAPRPNQFPAVPNYGKPQSQLVEGTNGMLYGTSLAGGTNATGQIYRLNKDGTGFQMIYHFGPLYSLDGRIPVGRLLLASDGFLYGTTYDGGTNGNGTVFRLAQDGTGYSAIASLASSQGPAAGLSESTNGVLYGTTQLGGISGDGAVFSLQKDGSLFTVLKSFSASGEDGAAPYSPPVVAATNRLIGTTRLGGSLAAGTVYSIRFDGQDYQPLSSLGPVGGPTDLFGSLLTLTNGTLAGTSRFGGSANDGAIFSLGPSGEDLTVLDSPTNSSTGQEYRAALIQASDGLLYGTTVLGGAKGGGTAFRMNADGSGYTVLVNFVARLGPNGTNPLEPLLEGSDGNLYGTTCFGGATNRGVVFRMSKDGSTYAVLKSFGIAAGDGEGPMSPLIEAGDGLLYGSTYGGGSSNNAGTVFRLSKDGTGFQIILAFNGAAGDGRHPCGALVEWSDGLLYGTTERGGINDQGTLFRVNKDGTGYQVLVSLGPDTGGRPQGGLIQGPDGALYGATKQGGDEGFGTVFRYGTTFGDIADFQVVNQIPTVMSVGQPGTNYVLERTVQLGPLASWLPVLSTNAPPTGQFSIADQSAVTGGNPQSFYRLRR